MMNNSSNDNSTRENLNTIDEECKIPSIDIESSDANDETEPVTKKHPFVLTKKMIILFSASTVAIALLIILFVNLGYVTFQVAYNMHDYGLAKKAQCWSINSDRTKANIKSFVTHRTNEAYADFLDEKITYKQAKKELDFAAKFYKNKKISKKTDNLQSSRLAFIKAQKHEKNGELYDELLEYGKVIESDKKNYAVAQEKLQQKKADLKEMALSQLDEYIKSNNFEEGLQYIDEIRNIFPDDSDFDSYEDDLYSIKRKHSKEKAKKEKTIEIVSVSIYKPEDSLFQNAKITFKNISSEIFTEADILVLFFDEDGYPIKPNENYFFPIDDDIPNSSIELVEKIIKPGETASLEFTLLPYTIKKIKVCGGGYCDVNGEFIVDPYGVYWARDEKERY